MATLVLGSLTVQIAAGPIPVEYEPAGITYRDRWDGTLEVERRGSFDHGRAWSWTTIPLSRADADTLVAQLLAAGTVEASGDAVGSPPQTVYVRGISREDVKVSGSGDGTDDRCTVTFETAGVDG